MRRARGDAAAADDNDDMQELLFRDFGLLAAKNGGGLGTSGQGAGQGKAPPAGGTMEEEPLVDDDNDKGKQEAADPTAMTTTTTKQPRPEIDPQMRQLARELGDLVRSGLQFLYRFIGMLDTQLGGNDVRSYYRYRYAGAPLDVLQNPVVYDPRTMRTPTDLVRENTRLLGPEFMRLAVPLILPRPAPVEVKAEEEADVEQQLVGLLTTPDVVAAGGGVPETVIDEAFLLNVVDAYQIDLGVAPSVASDWVFSAIDDAVIAHVLSDSTYALLQLAVEELRGRLANGYIFTLKKLLMSPDGVRSKFALLCKALRVNAAGGNAYVGRSQGAQQGMLRGTTFLVSAGIETRNRNSADICGAFIWFARVYEDVNPRYAQLESAIARLQARVTSDDAADGPPPPNYAAAPPYSLARIMIDNPGQLGLQPPVLRALRNLVFKRARDDPAETPALLRKAHTDRVLPVIDRSPVGHPNLALRLTNDELRRLNDYNYLVLMRRQLQGMLPRVLVSGD